MEKFNLISNWSDLSLFNGFHPASAGSVLKDCFDILPVYGAGPFAIRSLYVGGFERLVNHGSGPS